MIVVTGGAGFIGSNIVAGLNEIGRSDVVIVDDMTDAAKLANLRDLDFADYFDLNEFRRLVEADRVGFDVTAFSHQGACSDTMVHDGRYMLDNNFTYSKLLLHYALKRNAPFVYASSAATYGNASAFSETRDNERPLNIYGYSKLLFDRYVRRRLDEVKTTVVGLRYFNVYGPREDHKGRMKSIVRQLMIQIAETGAAKLFEGTDGYAHGEQRRDFVFVGDVVKVNLWLLTSSPRRGVVNVGTGASRTFNDVANAVIGAMGEGRIEYVPFNEALRGKYQAFTEADLTQLRALGYDEPFADLHEGVAKTVGWYQENQ